MHSSHNTRRAVAALLVAALAVGAHTTLTAQRRIREVPLGGLFPLTGSWSTQGQTLRAAMELAVEDVNRYLEGNAAGIRFVAAVENTQLDPALALERAKALRKRGAQLMIGPMSSAEVAYLKPYVDANGVLLISPASTAGSLAIVGDNVFRFTPSDSLEGVAISALMWEDGIRVIVPVWRDDAGGVGLMRATRAQFASLGGTVLEGVKYNASTRDFRATVAAVGAQVRQAMARLGTIGTIGTTGTDETDATDGAENVAVYLAGFDEVAALFAVASGDPMLASIHWYGSDGAAHSDSLLSEPRAAAFAIGTGFPNPVFGLDEGARDIWEPLAARIRARTGTNPDAYALTVYDAVWVVARGYVASGATLNIEQLKHAFTTAASTQFGATGWTVLNAAGDRKYGDFDFWAVREVGGKPSWVRVAQYETRTHRLFRSSTATPFRTSTLSLADIVGRWNIRAVPATGDTTVTRLVLNATANVDGWTMDYAPNPKPLPVRVLALAGDSLVIEMGPYMSARRPGLMAVSRDTYRLIGGRLVGYSESYYVTAPGNVIRLRLEGTRAP